MIKCQLLKIIPPLITLLNFGFIYAGFEWLGPEPLLMNNGEQIKKVSSYFKNEAQIALGDWDNDSDLDLVMFEVLDDDTVKKARRHRFYFIENIGTPEEHSFNPRKEFRNVTSKWTQ